MNDILGKPVHFQEALIEQNDAVIRIDDAEAVRHLGDGLVEALELDTQLILLALALSHILNKRDPTSACERPVVEREGAPARHLPQQAERLPARHEIQSP